MAAMLPHALLTALLLGGAPDAVRTAAALRSLRLAPVPPPPETAYAAALSGEVVTGVEDVSGPRRVWGVAVLDVPISDFWAAINDEEGKVRYTASDHQSLLAGEPCGPRRTVFQYAGGGALTDRWWVVDQRINLPLQERSQGQVRELTWRSVAEPRPLMDARTAALADAGMQIPFTEGAWLLVDLGDGRTLVEYSSRTDPGGWIPEGLGASFAAGGLQDNLEAMATLARSGPACKSI